MNIQNKMWCRFAQLSISWLPNAEVNLFFNDFSFRYRNSTYFAVICLVTLGLAWVSPEPDLPLPSLGYARDIKRSFPLEHNNQFQSREKFGLYIYCPNFSRDWHLFTYSSFFLHFSHLFPDEYRDKFGL